MFTSMPARRARAGLAFALAMVGGVLTAATPADATTVITLDPPATPAAPDTTFKFLVRISGTDPIAAYTLDLRVIPQAGATGTVTGNAAESNYYEAENLIANGSAGGGISTTFSSIGQSGNGLLINVVDSAFTATAVPGAGQDVLAEVAFDASADAFGDFRFELGGLTVLATDGGQSHPFESVLLTLNIPEPASLGLLGTAGLLLIHHRRRKMA